MSVRADLSPYHLKVVDRQTGRREDGKGIDTARTLLRYIQRDGVSKDHKPGCHYDADSYDADSKGYLKRSNVDRYQFQFTVSRQYTSELIPFVRDLTQGKTLNQNWAGDINYVLTQEGWRYLAVILIAYLADYPQPNEV